MLYVDCIICERDAAQIEMRVGNGNEDSPGCKVKLNELSGNSL